MHGDSTVHRHSSKSSFIRLKLLSHHWDHNIQRFLGLPQNIQKRSWKLRNTHFCKMCIVHSLVLWKAGREGGHYAVRSSMEHRWPEGAFTMQGVEREGSWAAGVQLKCGTCQPTWLSLRMCLGQWWIINMLYMVEGWIRKHLSGPSEGLWVKAEKWRAAKLRKRRRGRGAENAEPKERKGC